MHGLSIDLAYSWIMTPKTARMSTQAGADQEHTA
jgi:hypothetical protein